MRVALEGAVALGVGEHQAHALGLQAVEDLAPGSRPVVKGELHQEYVRLFYAKPSRGGEVVDPQRGEVALIA